MGKMENGLSLGIAIPRLSIKEQVFKPTVDLYLTVGVIALFSLLYLMLPFTIESFLVALERIIGTDFGKPFNVLFRRVPVGLESDSLLKSPLFVLHFVHDSGVS
jgi:hypothetical protein